MELFFHPSFLCHLILFHSFFTPIFLFLSFSHFFCSLLFCPLYLPSYYSFLSFLHVLFLSVLQSFVSVLFPFTLLHTCNVMSSLVLFSEGKVLQLSPLLTKLFSLLFSFVVDLLGEEFYLYLL